MFQTTPFALLVAALTLTVCLAPATAQIVKKPNNNRQGERRENLGVKNAQDEINDAQKAVREREQEVRARLDSVKQARQSKQSAASALQKVEERLEAKHGETTGFAAARDKSKAAQEEFQTRTRPVLDELKQQAEYKSAEGVLAKAKLAIKPNPDKSDADRQAAAKSYSQALAALHDLERQAIDAVPELKALRTNTEEAQAAVQAAKKKFDRAVENDADMQSAKQVFDKAKQAEDAAERDAAQAQRQLAEAKQKVAQATQRYQQKRAQDQKDDNRNNNGKGKKRG
jgi:chromosome segregation ATPase